MEEVDNFKYFEYEIKLDKPSASYCPGDVLSGYIEINVALPLEFKAINVTYSGDAFVYGQKRQINANVRPGRYVEVDYVAHEQYLKVTQCVSGVTTLSPGTHCILFQCEIPITAPSSFYSKYGCVHYCIAVNVEYKDLKEDNIVKEFEVVAPLDLNGIDNVRHPILLEFQRAYGIGELFVHGSLEIGICLPTRGYCPGQRIPIDVCVSNKTYARVRKIIIQLVRRQSYHNKTPDTSDSLETEVATVKTKKVKSYTDRNFVTHLNIPPMVSEIAPNLQNCSIIDVEFFIKVTVKLSIFKIKREFLTDYAKIYIGSIPLSEWQEPSFFQENSDVDYPNLNAINPCLPTVYPTFRSQMHVVMAPSAPPMD